MSTSVRHNAEVLVVDVFTGRPLNDSPSIGVVGSIPRTESRSAAFHLISPEVGDVLVHPNKFAPDEGNLKPTPHPTRCSCPPLLSNPLYQDPAAISAFGELFWSSKLAHISTMDLCVLSAVIIDPIREDMRRRGVEPELAKVALFSVPLVGPAAWMLVRPPVE